MLRYHREPTHCLTACFFAILSILAIPADPAIAATWENNANGQQLVTPCGSALVWPDNNSWTQDEVVGECSITTNGITSRYSYVFQPSNWDVPAHPNSPSEIVGISGASPTVLDKGVEVNQLSIGQTGVLEIAAGGITAFGNVQVDGAINGTGGGNLTMHDDNGYIDNRGIIAGLKGTLNVEPKGELRNESFLQASRGGTLRLRDGRYLNRGSIESANDSTVEFYNDSVLVGGQLSSVGTGRVKVAFLQETTWIGTIQNDAHVVNFNGSIAIEDSLNLSGSGRVELQTAYIRSVPEVGGAKKKLVQGAGHTIEGSGWIDGGLQHIGDPPPVPLDFLNLGMVNANVPGAELSIVTAGMVENEATMKSSNGGTLVFGAGIVLNRGLISAEPDSTVSFRTGSMLKDGRLASSGSGQITIRGFQVSAWSGTIQNESHLVIGGRLSISNELLLSGNGRIEMQNGRLRGFLAEDGVKKRLVQSSSHTIEGYGWIDGAELLIDEPVQVPMDFLNHGIVNANKPGASLIINTAGKVENQATMKAEGGGQLVFVSGSLTNDGIVAAIGSGSKAELRTTSISGAGNWLADGGSLVFRSQAAVDSSGELASKNLGSIQLDSAGARFRGIATDSTARFAATGSVTVDYLTFETQNASDWMWSSSSKLTVASGVGQSLSNFSGWGHLEVGGADVGLEQLLPTGEDGFTNANFYIPELVISAGANVNLFDEFDNSLLRPGSEALYVGRLRFEDPTARLNLNGLSLYLKELTGNREQIVDYGVIAPGDFSENDKLDVADIDRLVERVRSNSYDPRYDLDNNSRVELDDLSIWLHELRLTYFGDANLDGVFDSSDLVEIFREGQYEDSVPGNSNWSSGDWDGSGDFDSSDLVKAFQDGGYEQGPRPVAVPEPTASILSLLLFAGISLRRRRVM